MIHAYISGVGVLLPNAPVTNAEIENVLGPINGIASRTKRIILRNNGILTRHYAIDPATGRPTHSNAQLTAEAVRSLARSAGFPLDAIDCLVCATSSPDQWIPNHGLMVHGELKCPPCEVAATSGVCASGMTALKYAWMSVTTGQSRRAVATGSEVSSSVLRASLFPARVAPGVQTPNKTASLCSRARSPISGRRLLPLKFLRTAVNVTKTWFPTRWTSPSAPDWRF